MRQIPRGCRVLLIAPLPPPVGGIATWARTLVDAGKHHDVEFIHIDSSVRWRSIVDAPMYSRAVGGAVHLVYLWVAAIYRSLLTRPDAAHIASSAQLGLVRDSILAMTFRAMRIPVFLHLHRGATPELSSIVRARNAEFHAVRLAIALSTKTIVLNEDSLTALSSVSPEKVCLIPNMLSDDIARSIGSYLKTPSERPNNRILFVGHLNKRKGILDLIYACDALQDRGILDVTITAIGPADDASIINELQKRTWVTHLGAQPNHVVIREMMSHSILCLPSYGEGLPYVILEAMATGLPVAASAVGGIPDALADGRGFLFKAGDVESITQTLLEALSKPQLRMETASKAQAFCNEYYSSTSVVAQLRSLWRGGSRQCTN